MAILASSVAIHDTGKLFEPDAILPAQYYSMFKSSQYRPRTKAHGGDTGRCSFVLVDESAPAQCAETKAI